MNTQELSKIIEQGIDDHGLTAVTDCLIEICYAKAEHLRSNWQDDNAARVWDNAGLSLANPKEPYASIPFPS